MTVTYASGQVQIDFNAKTLINESEHDLNADFGKSELAKDSLGAATQAFIAAIFDQQPVMVSARDGLIAVNVATQIMEGWCESFKMDWVPNFGSAFNSLDRRCVKLGLGKTLIKNALTF